MVVTRRLVHLNRRRTGKLSERGRGDCEDKVGRVLGISLRVVDGGKRSILHHSFGHLLEDGLLPNSAKSPTIPRHGARVIGQVVRSCS